MSSTDFSSGTVISSSWLNGVDTAAYARLGTVSGTDVLVATGPESLTSYTDTSFEFVATGTNTGATTINISSLGAVAITKFGATPLVAGDITDGQLYRISYDGTQYQLINAQSVIDTSTFIKTTGDQTKAGVLTLTSSPIIPDAAISTNPVSKGQADSSYAIIAVPSSTEVKARTENTKRLTSASLQNVIVSGTVVASTSGTSIDFTGIPSWVTRVTIALSGVSTNGTSVPLVQIGSGSIDTSGYLGTATTAAAYANYTTGFGLAGANQAARIYNGFVTLVLLGNNTWVINGITGLSDQASLNFTGGSKVLSGALDRVRLTTVGGTDTFDAGSVNILYE